MAVANRRGMRAGVLGLAVGCGVAVWMVNYVAAQVYTKPPPPDQPMPAVSEADRELRKLFPLKSVTKRLDYEKASLEALAKEEPSPRMTEETRKRLAALEDAMEMKRRASRSQKLLQLYSDPVPPLSNAHPTVLFGMFGVSFTPSSGQLGQLGASPLGQFGASPLTRKELEMPSTPPLGFAAVRYGDSSKAPTQASRAPGTNMLMGLHVSGVFDFLDPAGFGYVQDREHVAGFEPHQFHAALELAGANERWVVIRLELVSMLKHKEVVAYATDVFPNVTDSDNAPTRPLNLFERKALKALREGDDLTTESSGDRIRMVSSLRATKQCLECHQVKRGDLLGAFSWELQRQTAEEGK